jgi:hypothetical protein
MYAAVDGLVDRLRRQAVTYHDKRGHGRPRHALRATTALGLDGGDPETTEDVESAEVTVGDVPR